MLPAIKVGLIALAGGLALFLTAAVILSRKTNAAHLSMIRARWRADFKRPAYAAWMKAARGFEDTSWEFPELSGTSDWTRSTPAFAEQCYREALAACKQEGRPPADQAAAEAGLARVKLSIVRIGQAPVANLWEAIEFGKRALETYTLESNPEAWASAQLTLAAAHCERHESSHRDIKQAIGLCEKVIKGLCGRSDVHTVLCARAYCTEAEACFKQSDLQRAERHYRDALTLLEPAADRKQLESIADRRHLARVLCGLGRTYLKMIQLPEVIAPNDPETRTQVRRLSEAERCFQRAAALLPKAKVSPELSDARQGIADVNELSRPFPLELTHDRQWSSASLDRRHRALVQKKAEIGASSTQTREAAMKGGDLYFRDGVWDQALRAYKRAIDADKTLFYHSVTGQGRRAFAGSGERAYRHAAFCHIKLEELDQALLMLDRGKTRVLNERLNRDQARWNLVKDHEDQKKYEEAFKDYIQRAQRLEVALQSGGAQQDDALTASVEEARDRLRSIERELQKEHPDFLADLSIEDFPLLVADNQTAIVVPVLTGMGGAVILVTAQGHLEAIELPDFDLPAAETLIWKLEDEQVRQWLATGNEGGWSRIVSQIIARGSADVANELGWVPAYHLHYAVARMSYGLQDGADAYRITQQWWWDVMQRVLEDLYTAFWSPILDALPDQVEHLIVVPQGVLHLIPAGAALQSDGDGAIIDRYTVSYAPSLNVLQRCVQSAGSAANTRPSLLAAIGSQAAGRLPYAGREINAIAHIWEEQERATSQLLKDDVTAEAFLERAASANYIHYSGHAEHDWSQPENSGLLVESGNPLTVDEIERQGVLRTSRLVVLSACETGLVDIKTAPEEYVGLPAAFMLAGVPCVLSSLWPVEDLSTALLMARFYEIHLKENLPPSQALRAAQRWLRAATREQVIKYCESHGWMNLDLRVELSEGEDDKYCNPYFCAPFICAGI